METIKKITARGTVAGPRANAWQVLLFFFFNDIMF